MNLPPLKILDIDGESLELLESFSFLGITVPAGFRCDGQSWCIGEKKAQRAAVLHDWLYYHCGKVAEAAKLAKDRQAFSKGESDAIFRDALIACGVGRFRAWVRWTGLKAAGWVAWNKHKKRNLAALACLALLTSSGCMFGYDRETIGDYERRSWVISIASKSNARKAEIGGISIERGSTEAQPEVVREISKGAVEAFVKP